VGSFEDGVGKTLIGSVITGNSFERGSFVRSRRLHQ
jgi:hypothetical protein